MRHIWQFHIWWTQDVGITIVHVKKHLSFTGLRNTLANRFQKIGDHRGRRVEYSISDCLMSAFAMMFFQDASLLEFQRRLKVQTNFDNLQTLFGVEAIPADSQLREVLDFCEPEPIAAVFSDFFRPLQRGKHLEQFQVLDGQYLVLLDATQIFSSEKIHCPHCLHKTSAKGKVRYQHQVLQVVIAHPDHRQVIPLAPEPIRNEDGKEKQDCEINAGKRIIQKIRQNHPKLKIIIGGDDLYSKQPFIEELEKAGMSYVLVAKPSDHKVLYEWFCELRGMNETKILELTDHKKVVHHYEWANKLPLNGDQKARDVNYFEYTQTKGSKTLFHSSWVTDIGIHENNIVMLVKIGRARWKVENESFNTLKNQGYHLEHNFGHGRKNLSYIFYLLNILAFFCHQIFELTDPLYQKCRSAFSARKEYWNQLRCTIRILVFNSWQHLLEFIIDPKANPPPWPIVIDKRGK